MTKHNKHMQEMHKEEKRYDNVYQIVIAVLATLLIVSLFTGGFQFEEKGSGTDTTNTDSGRDLPSAPSGNSAPSVDMAALMDDDAVKGDPNAPVTIVEWSDFECPYCARFYQQTYGSIVSEYIDTGKVKLVFRDFPLSFHANAQKAAEAAECAGEQDKFYEMHDLIFEKGVVGGVSTFKQYATEIGLDQDSFDACLDSGAMASEVAADMQAGAAAGVKGTPGFIINGQLISGAQPFSVFKQVIEAELAKVQ